MLARLRARLTALTGRWLFQLRGAEAGEVYLTQRRVFIVPSRAGLGFLLLLLVLFLASVNYDLGLGFALTFLLGACALVDMVLTTQNLAHLHLAAGRTAPVFAGEEALFELHLINRTRRDRYAIGLDLVQAGAPRHMADVAAAGSAPVQLSLPTAARGWLTAPRVRLVSRFPLGLFRSWCYWQPDARLLVYPHPEPVAEAPPLPLHGTAGSQGGGHSGHDDFAGIRSYQAGDPMRHLAWRQIARFDPALGGQLVTKHFEGGVVTELCLDYAALPPQLGTEARLARLARWVIEAEQRQLAYGFHLGRLRYPAALGEAHRAACLEALALYGQPEGVA
jgi:uncharacterized protein (DUF58 family)